MMHSRRQSLLLLGALLVTALTAIPTAFGRNRRTNELGKFADGPPTEIDCSLSPINYSYYIERCHDTTTQWWINGRCINGRKTEISELHLCMKPDGSRNYCHDCNDGSGNIKNVCGSDNADSEEVCDLAWASDAEGCGDQGLTVYSHQCKAPSNDVAEPATESWYLRESFYCNDQQVYDDDFEITCGEEWYYEFFDDPDYPWLHVGDGHPFSRRNMKYCLDCGMGIQVCAAGNGEASCEDLGLPGKGMSVIPATAKATTTTQSTAAATTTTTTTTETTSSSESKVIYTSATAKATTDAATTTTTTGEPQVITTSSTSTSAAAIVQASQDLRPPRPQATEGTTATQASSSYLRPNNVAATNVAATDTDTPPNAQAAQEEPTSRQVNSIALNPIADTWLEYNDDEAYGMRKRLKVDGHILRTALLKFNMSSLLLTNSISSVNNDLLEVKLRLYSLTSSPFGGKVDLLNSRCDDWDELTLSYMNAPSCALRNSTRFYVGEFDNGEVSENAWNEASLDLKMKFSDDTLPKVITLKVTSNYANGTTYASREADGNVKPELVVSYYTTAADLNSDEVVQAEQSVTEEVGEEQPDVPTTTSPTKSPSQSPMIRVPTKTYDAVIIGAGWAGLKAAKTLLDSGITSILILEASDYIGGRSKSVNSDGTINVPNMDDSIVPYDLGSEWLYNTGSDMEETLVRTGFLSDDVLDNDKDSAIPLETGQFYQQSNSRNNGVTAEVLENEDVTDLMDKVWGGFLQFRGNRLDRWEDTSYADAIDRYIERFDLTGDELQFINLIEDVLETEYTGDSSQLDISEIEFFPPNYSVKTHYMAVPGLGFGNVASEYAAAFASKIQLNSKVTEINYQNDQRVVIKYVEDGGSVQRVKAKTVLVTVSLGVLKAGSIKFDPVLPSGKQNSIDNMGFGLVNKCIMTWNNDDAIVWPMDQYWFLLITPEDETSGQWTTFSNPSKFKGVPSLTAWIGGDEAVKAEELSDDEIMSDVMKNLKSMFPSIRKPDNVIISRWGQDDNVRGTYSFPVPGRDFYDDAANVKRRVGRVWFAGEATGSGWATTMGAWNSGEEAAKKMSEMLEEV